MLLLVGFLCFGAGLLVTVAVFVLLHPEALKPEDSPRPSHDTELDDVLRDANATADAAFADEGFLFREEPSSSTPSWTLLRICEDAFGDRGIRIDATFGSDDAATEALQALRREFQLPAKVEATCVWSMEETRPGAWQVLRTVHYASRPWIEISNVCWQGTSEDEAEAFFRQHRGRPDDPSRIVDAIKPR